MKTCCRHIEKMWHSLITKICILVYCVLSFTTAIFFVVIKCVIMLKTKEHNCI